MTTVGFSTSRTQSLDPATAAEELVAGLGSAKPKLVTLFAARRYDHAALNRAVRDRLPKGTRLIGASTGGEIDRNGMHEGTAVLGALEGDVEVGLGLGGGLSSDAHGAGSKAVAQACEQLGVRAPDLDPRRHVGLVIDDGFRFKKEEMLLGMLEKNQALILVGGGASDSEPDPAKQSALLHVDGEVVTDAALIAIFKTDAPFAAMRSHWYQPTGQTLTITKVDDSATRALEIDGQPAAARYAEVLGVSVDDLEFGKPKGFATLPTALKVGREYFIRAPWKPLPDGSILFANLLEQDTELELMRLGDMVASTKRFLEVEIPQRVRSPRGAIFLHCSGRKWFGASAGKIAEISAAFEAAPMPCVGMNVHFEIYCGFHINTTLTALVFGGN